MRTHIRRYPTPAHTYHFDFTNGLDTNTGAADKPRKTVTHLNSMTLRPGDRVLFAGDQVWQGTAATSASRSSAAIRCTNSGKSGRPIYYGKYGSGDDPLFDQCVIYTDWSSYDSPTYRRAEGNDDDFGRHLFQGANRLLKATSVAAVKTTTGSWYGSSGYVYVHTTTNADPNGLLVGYPCEEGYPSGFDTRGKSYITVENLHITRAKNHSFTTDTGDYSYGITALNCTASWAGARGFRFIGATKDINHQMYGCRIQNCVAYDTLAEGIWVGGGQIFVEDCETYNIKKDYSTTLGDINDMGGILIGIFADGSVIRRCYAHDSYHNCLGFLEYESIYGGEVARPKNCIIENNHFLNNRVEMINGVGVALQGDSSCVFRNNLVESTSVGSNTNSVGIGNECQGMQVYNNTIINRVNGDSAWVLNIGANSSAVVKNNILRQTVSGLSVIMSSTASGTFSNNCYSSGATGVSFYSMKGANEYGTAAFNNWLTAIGDTNSMLALPIFVNETSDPHLQSNSPCKNVGVTGLGVVFDYDYRVRDASPDIGAYEFA